MTSETHEIEEVLKPVEAAKKELAEKRRKRAKGHRTCYNSE